MANLATKIPNFIGKAQAKMSVMGDSLIADFDPQGYQSEGSEDLLLKVYETRKFINLLLSSDYGGMTSKQISDNIDFFWKWLELNKILFVNYTNYQIPIQQNTIVPSGNYALAADLTAEIDARAQGDSALDVRIDDIEAQLFTAASVFPAGFWDNYVNDYSVVFDDDTRLHTHSNKAQLDLITGTMITNLTALGAHYTSIGNSSGVHVSSSDRTTWNAKVSTIDLNTAIGTRAPTNHTHAIGDITLLNEVIAAINDDIANMAGADGREVELQRNGDNLEWRYVGDTVWIDLGEIKGDQGDQGDPFVIDVQGLSNDRFNSLYDSEDNNFTFLETDTGYLYFRKPSGGLATVPAGWSDPIPFVGYDGWSPHLGMYEVSAGRTVMELVDWIGGEGNKPFLDPGSNPPTPVRWFVGQNGYTLDPMQAINVKGPIGIGYGPIVGAVGAIAGRSAHDAKSAGFIYMRNDVSPQTIFIKNSDTSADWSAELPWQGPPGSSIASFPNQIANVVFSGPPSGGAVAPTFRYLVADDIPVLDASKITTGVFDIARIPAAALERIFIYTGAQTLPENMGLTNTDVQNGDVVRIENVANINDKQMWVVADDSALSTAASFKQFTAGTAATVPWAGLTGSPTAWLLTGSSTITTPTIVGNPYFQGSVLIGPAAVTLTANTRLDVRGTSGTNIGRFADDSNNAVFTVLNSGLNKIGNSANAVSMHASDNGTGVANNTGNSLGVLISINNTSSGVPGFVFRTSNNPAAGTKSILGSVAGGISFALAAGTTIFNYFQMEYTINTTAAYVGTARGLYYNPTVTSDVGLNHVAIETTSGKLIHTIPSATGSIIGYSYTLGSADNGTTSIVNHALSGVYTNGASWNGAASQIAIQPTYNTNGATAGVFYGVVYNPTVTQIGTSQHYAFAATSGDIVWGGANSSSYNFWYNNVLKQINFRNATTTSVFSMYGTKTVADETVAAINFYNDGIGLLGAILVNRHTANSRGYMTFHTSTGTGGSGESLRLMDDRWIMGPLQFVSDTYVQMYAPGVPIYLHGDNIELTAGGGGGFGSGVGVVSIGEVITPPTINAAGCGLLYVETGILKYRGPSGTVTPIALP
jgi:hypothetical protein